jgi:hypothetical protein
MAAAVVVAVAACGATFAKAARGQRPTAAEKYRNIQVLKDLPADELDGTMRFMAASLGVGCDFCHVTAERGPWPLEKDDKAPKQTTRKMIELQNAINDRDFDGKPTVNCASCHHGRPEPDRLPPLASQLTAGEAARTDEAAPGQRPLRPTETLDQVLDQYVQALGGRAALDKLKTRLMRGTVVTRAGRSFPVVVEETTTGKYRQVIEVPQAATVRAFDGTAGWIQSGNDIFDVNGYELQQLTRLIDLSAPLRMKERYESLSVIRYDRLDRADTIVLLGHSAANVTEQLYFDRQSGLLLRRVVRTRTPLGGTLPEQIDYSDYRPVSGVKMPFQIRSITWDSVGTQKFDEIKVNTPLDEARFTKPAT